MFKFFHKIFSTFLTKPSVHYLKPKSMNLFFKESKNPEFHYLSLDKYDYVTIKGTKQKLNEEDNEYLLNLELHRDEKNETLTVAKFNNRLDLESAMLVLKNKFYSPEKVIVKSIFVVVATFLILIFLLNLVKQFTGSAPQDMSAANAQMIQQLQQMHQQGQVPSYQLPPGVANNPNAAYDALQQAKAQADAIVANGVVQDSNRMKQAIAGEAVVNQQPSASPSQPAPSAPIKEQKDPAMQNFLNGLK